MNMFEYTRPVKGMLWSFYMFVKSAEIVLMKLLVFYSLKIVGDVDECV